MTVQSARGAQVSAEIRWFWPDTAFPHTLIGWFKNGPGVGGGRPPPREDLYLLDREQHSLGVKKRGSKAIEVKGLVASGQSASELAPFRGPIEIWCKWSSSTLDLKYSPVLRVQKLRWLRKYSLTVDHTEDVMLNEDEVPIGVSAPTYGCNVELTEVRVPELEGRWWTLGFEAFGNLSNVETLLSRSLDHTVSKLGAPKMTGGELMSYPTWLTQLSN